MNPWQPGAGCPSKQQLKCRECWVNTRENRPVTVYANVGIDAGVEIGARLAAHGAEAAEIHIGYGPELIIDCANVESLERLRDVAAEGARLLQGRIEKNRSAAAQERAAEAGQLVGAGATR
jgi:hypothetical protein